MNSNQRLYYPDTGEVIVDDVHPDQSMDAVLGGRTSSKPRERVRLR